MVEKFKDFANMLYEKIKVSEFKLDYVSDFCCELENDSTKYIIKYDSPCIILENSGKKISEWMFNSDTSNKDAELILDDFCNYIAGKKQKKFKAEKKDGNSSDEVNFDSMVSRVLQFFPEERDQYSNNFSDSSKISEKISFIKEKIIPQINNMVNRSRDDKRLVRLFSNLCKDYAFGDDDTKCVVSMLFFNGIEGKQSRSKVKDMLPMYMKKTWIASERYRR